MVGWLWCRFKWWLRDSGAVAVLVGFDDSPSESGGSTIFFARLASVPDPAGGSDFLKSPGDVAPPIGLLGDFVIIANDGTV